MMIGGTDTSKLIRLATSKEKGVKSSAIRSRTEKLLQLISSYIQENTLAEVPESLLAELHIIRYELMDCYASNGTTLDDLYQETDEYILDKYKQGSHLDLSLTIAEVLSNQEQVTVAMFEKMETSSFEDMVNKSQENRVDYNTIKIISTIPSPQLKLFKGWTDASLKLEFGLIVADLVVGERVDFDKDRIENELIPFLNDMVIKYGAYAYALEIWMPSMAEETQFEANARILSRILESEAGVKGYEIEMEDLSRILKV